MRYLVLLFLFWLKLPVTWAGDLVPPDSSSLVIDTLITENGSESSAADSVQTDTVNHKKTPKPPYLKQFRFGADIARLGFNMMFPSRQAYEFQVDYALRNDIYIAAETGFGRGKVDYDFLKYNTNAYFIRIGIDKSFLDCIGIEDFDMGFLGARYGIGIGQLGDATYTIRSPFGSVINDEAAGEAFVVHWAEIVGGIKVELWKGIFAGWTGRGKFIFNPGIFKEHSPNFIGGYGKGDKTSAFDFNFYISYSIRWGKQE